MKSVINTLNKYKYLLQQLVWKNIKLKYRRSYLGYVWTLLEPLLTMIVLAVVFDKLRGKDDPCFPVYILTGRLLYNFFSNGTKSAMKSIRSNASMIKKVYVPKYMYPVSGVISNFIIFLLSLLVLVLTEAFFKIKPTLYLLLAWVPLLVLLVMTMGVGLILSTMAVFFRDLEYLWNIALMLIMYCSAIFYSPASVAKEGFSWVFDLNPLYGLILNFRNLVLYGRGFDLPSMTYSACFAAVSLLVGLVVFYKKQDDFILNI